MTASISLNLNQTTNGLGSFNVDSVGYIQGQAQDDPSTRFRLRGGVLSTAETLPMWGGVGVYAFVPKLTYSATSPVNNLGPVLGRATALTGSYPLLGFSVFDQDYAMVSTPQSPVPLQSSGGRVHYYPLGSLARVQVACDPILADLAGEPLNSAVSWDYVNQQLIPYAASINVNALSYNSTTGLVTLTLASASGLGVGDSVTVAGLTGTGSIASANGTFTTAAGTTGTTLTYFIATGLTLTYTSGGTIATAAAIPVNVLDINLTNSMTVVYSGGNATWNLAGCVAVIQI